MNLSSVLELHNCWEQAAVGEDGGDGGGDGDAPLVDVPCCCCCSSSSCCCCCSSCWSCCCSSCCSSAAGSTSSHTHSPFASEGQTTMPSATRVFQPAMTASVSGLEVYSNPHWSACFPVKVDGYNTSFLLCARRGTPTCSSRTSASASPTGRPHSVAGSVAGSVCREGLFPIRRGRGAKKCATNIPRQQFADDIRTRTELRKSLVKSRCGDGDGDWFFF